jgi:hypothetical protein
MLAAGMESVALSRRLPTGVGQVVTAAAAEMALVERLKAFQAQGGGSRSTYFNLARRLQTAEPAPAIKLNNLPPARRAEEDSLQKIMRRWNQHFGEN